MAGVKISNLPAIVTPAMTDIYATVQGGVTYKVTGTQLSSLFLPIAGGTLTGNLTLFGDPTTNLMAATKQYVDSVASGLNVQPSCVVATTVALTVTYLNGASGVGASLTNAGVQAALSIDGVSLSVGQRVLVKNQASTFQNGIYTVTNIGSGATNWIMTRATDYDTAAEITPGDFVLILSGSLNAQTQWVQTATVVTVGTDAITWDQFGADINTLIVNIQNEAYTYVTDTGAADAYVATLSPAVTAYVAGLRVQIKVANANTGASTLNVNGLGVKNIKTLNGLDPLAGDLIIGMVADLIYDGTNFQILDRNIAKRIQNESYNYILDTGAADVYVATLVPAVTAYVAGLRVSLKIANANATTTPTVNVNGLGAKTITTIAGGALLANDLVVGMIADLRYDGTNFQLLDRNKLVPTSLTITAAGLVTGGGDLSTNRTITVTASVQADQETGTSNAVAVTPGVQKFHPSASKANVVFDGTQASPVSLAGYGITSITKNGTGDYTLTFSTAFSSANYIMNGNCSNTTAMSSVAKKSGGTYSTTQFQIIVITIAGVAIDQEYVSLSFYGDQ